MMLKRILFLLGLCCVTTALGAGPLTGSWTGHLQVTPTNSLRLVMHIDADGSVELDSPDQGQYGLKSEVKFLEGDSIAIAIPTLSMSYSGVLTYGMLKGNFRQGGFSMPLNFIKGGQKVRRPQTPHPPFPYSSEELRIANPSAPGVELAGTLVVPFEQSERKPMVIFVTGSGLQNRDEELFGHKPFAVIADYLARKGIASFRYDDRGGGKSSGEHSGVTTIDNAGDAHAVLEYFKDDNRFGARGILGHSEGGMVAYMLGSGLMGDSPDFAVSIAGPSVRGDSILAYQNEIHLLASGVNPEIAAQFSQAVLDCMAYSRSHPGESLSTDTLERIFPPATNPEPLMQELGQGLKSLVENQNEWLRWFVNNSPAEYLGKCHIPLLMIYGDLDQQVPPVLNYPAAQKLAPNAQIIVFHGLNHPMQHAVTGQIDEYSKIEETIAPEVLETIAEFILKQK